MAAWVLLGALVVVIAVQFANRLAGAVLSLAWTLGMAWWGYQQIQGEEEIRFFFLRGDPQMFWLFMAVFLAWNTFALVRAIRDRPRRAAPIDARRDRNP